MKWKKELGKVKTCPRCGLQYMEGLVSCPDCGLIFSRLDHATNHDAKQKIKRFDFDYIIKTNKLPSDLSFIRLLLYSIFFGVFGGHCFYVGRYFRGGFLLINFLFFLCLAIFNSEIALVADGALLGVLSTICGFIMLLWIWDIIMIAIKRFKVPIAIDLENERAIHEKEQQDREKFFNEVKEIEKNVEIIERQEINIDKLKEENIKENKRKKDENSSRN